MSTLTTHAALKAALLAAAVEAAIQGKSVERAAEEAFKREDANVVWTRLQGQDLFEFKEGVWQSDFIYRPEKQREQVPWGSYMDFPSSMFWITPKFDLDQDMAQIEASLVIGFTDQGVEIANHESIPFEELSQDWVWCVNLAMGKWVSCTKLASKI